MNGSLACILTSRATLSRSDLRHWHLVDDPKLFAEVLQRRNLGVHPDAQAGICFRNLRNGRGLLPGELGGVPDAHLSTLNGNNIP